MKLTLMIIPIMTFLVNIAILLDIPFFREIIVFVFLSFVPGFAILRLFKLNEITSLDAALFSVALSIAFVMFIGLLVNELFLFLGFSQPLSAAPLISAVSAFTLAFFLIEQSKSRHNRRLEAFELKKSFENKLENILLFAIMLFLLPFLGVLGVFYLNADVLLLLYAAIAALCIMSIVFRRLVPENLYPLLILSISAALVCLVPLTSKYIIGFDANLEYYVFRVTQLNGYWGFVNPSANSIVTQTYNSMLSITLLPAAYSTLMHVQGNVVFKILYPFILSLIPLALYRIYEKQFGKLIGLLSVFFFIFTSTAFYGVEILSLNRQIVAEFFLVLSIFILISKNIPVTKRRWLLIIFGAALAVSHYSLGYIYLGIVAVFFIVSRVKPRADNALNSVTLLLLFVITLSWYALFTGSPLSSFTETIKWVSIDLTKGISSTGGVASSMFYIPQAFSVGIWINILLSGIANLFLMIGVLSIILRPREKGIFPTFAIILIIAAVILAISFVAPAIASTLNFTRFYGITLLFLSPCFVFGGQAILTVIRKMWTKIKRPLKSHVASKSKVDIVFLLIAVILSAYFLSQVGFVNRVTNSAIAGYTVNMDRMINSNESEVKTSLYSFYIPEQEVFSASWLQSHKVETAQVYSDSDPRGNVLISYGLIPNQLLIPLTSSAISSPIKGSFIYLGSLNIVNDVVFNSYIGSFNTSEISSLLNQNSLVYSNGNSEIWYVNPDSD